MEIRPFHHQNNHHRYDTPPSNFSGNPNFYSQSQSQSRHRLPSPPPMQQYHHHHNQQTPYLPHRQQPPVPQHLPQHLRPHLPPPPLPSPQSNFSFHPSPGPAPALPGQFSNFVPPHLLNQQARPSLSPPRVPSNHQYNHRHRNPSFYNENSRFSDRWPDLPPPPPPPRAPVEPDFHYKPQQQQQRLPLSPLPSRIHSHGISDFERSARFRDDRIYERFRNAANSEIPSWGGWKERDLGVVDDGSSRRYHSGYDGFDRNISPAFVRDVHKINRDLESVDSRDVRINLSPFRDHAMNMERYESYNEGKKESRWAYSRLENDHEGFEDDRASLPSHGVRRELLGSCYDDDDRLGSDRVEEGGEELYSRSVKKKQVQKKSALLRIQLGKGNSRSNSRNTNHDNSRYSRAYYDDAKSSFGGSLKGKEKDDSVYPDRITEKQREKSPVELDVSFKSNALVAKAVKTTSSPMAESDKYLAPRNRKLKKINPNDVQGIKLSEDLVKATCSADSFGASSSSDKDHMELAEKIISFHPDAPVGGLDSLSSSDKCNEESLEKVITVETDYSAPGLNFPSSPGKNMEVLTKDISMCDCRTNAIEENKAVDKSSKFVCSNGGCKRVASDGTLLQIARKRKTVGVYIKNETTDADNSSTSSQSAASQLDEGVSLSRGSISSASTNAMNGVLSPSTNDLTAKEVNNASEYEVADIKEDGVGISSSLQILSQFPALLSLTSNPGDTDPNEGCSSETKSVDNELFELNSDKGLLESQNTSILSRMGDLDDSEELPCSNRLVENDLLRKETVSVQSNSGSSNLKENKVHDGHLDVSSLNHNACSASTLCKSPGSIPVTPKDYIAAGSGEFVPHQTASHENDIDIDSPYPNLCFSAVGMLGPSKIEKQPICEAAGNHDLCNISSNLPAGSKSFFSDSSPKNAVPETWLQEDIGKQSIADGATTVPLDAPQEVSSKSMVSHSPRAGKKRKFRDGQLDIHVKLTSETDGSTACCSDDNSKSSTACVAKNLVSVEEEVDLGNGSDNVTGCPKEGPTEFNPSVRGGKKRKNFSSVLLCPVLSETSRDSKDATKRECLFNAEEQITQAEDRVDLSSSYDTAFAGVTAFLETSVISLRKDVTAGESYHSPGGGSKGQSAILETGMSSPAKSEADKNDSAPVSLPASDLPFGDMRSVSGDMLRSNMKEIQCSGDIDHANHLILEESLAACDNISLCANLDGVSASSSTSRQIDSVPDTVSCMGSPEDVISSMSMVILNDGIKLGNLSDITDRKSPISDKNPISGGDMIPLSLKPPYTTQTVTKSGNAVPVDLAIDTKVASLLSRKTVKVPQDRNPILKNSSLTNSWPSSSVSSNFSGPTSIKYPSAAKVSPFNHVARPRTWHRTLSSSPQVVVQKQHGNCILPQSNNRKEVGKIQSSYVRQGNSLVRKPYPVVGGPQVVKASRSSIERLDSGTHDMGKGGESKNTTSSIHPPGSASLDASRDCPVRPKTPPLMGSLKLLDYLTPNSEDLTFSVLDDPPRSNCPGEIPSVSAKHVDSNRSSQDEAKSSLNGFQTGVRKDLDCQNDADENNKGKKIIYVKRKSNQLVAASDSDDISLHSGDKTQLLSSGGYYKRRKNQLIRTSLEEGSLQEVVPEKILGSQQQDAQKNSQTRCSSKRLPGKGFMKKKFSLVWTLRNTMPSRKNGSSERWQTVLPNLFPWRRATYWTNFMHSLSAIPVDGAVSTIGQKLLLSRKRDAIYKRSSSGFSLRRSKVLSVGGRSLKWSKSIERSSRKANEDATLAVVAAEKRKRARHGAVFTLSKSRNCVSRKSVYSVKLCPGKRIFRIGSERYRMDSTRKTLQRISDELPSYSENRNENNRKKFYVPRRLLIGSDEYVRIGNGNQLVRDPKRRIRILANEKVRWSLHTARLRLARKKKYCQFFTRFGKCNKDDKKCPYIHDPSKIVVCTKFLNGSCSNPNCKLTHKVIPERMQDCSYFLQGSCSNESCPYRHVNVNPNSPVCEGFLRGYCADGNECQKKHTYVCPVFEANGDCPQGPTCKLHHPKKKRKGMKRKAASVQKNARGRYFGAKALDIVDSKGSEIVSRTGEDIFAQDGKFTDYIGLDVSFEEMEQAFEPRSEPPCYIEEPSSMEEANIDELIKPVRLMNKNLISAASPAVISPRETTRSYVSEDSSL